MTPFSHASENLLDSLKQMILRIMLAKNKMLGNLPSEYANRDHLHRCNRYHSVGNIVRAPWGCSACGE